MSAALRVGLIIPALNEAESIGGVVRDALAQASSEWTLRVVVGDNGSCDGTAVRAAAAGAEVVVEPARGYGAACLAAIAHLGAWPDALAFADGDGASDLTELPALLRPLRAGAADMVLGWRRAARPGSMSAPQCFGNALTTRLLRWRFGTHCRDLGPFRAITRHAYERLDMSDRTWGWTIEMQIKASRHGLRVVEWPVTWRSRTAGHSKISGTVKGVVRAGTKILWTFARHAIRRSPTTAAHRRPAVLCLFKYPHRGQVKTRLGATVGDDAALRLYRRLAGEAHHAARTVQDSGLADVALWGAGAAPARFHAWLPGSAAVHAQIEGDLGARLRHAFDTAFSTGAPAAVAIGADCPGLGADQLSAALAALGSADVVTLPTPDGGYALIGMRTPQPALFDAIPWSTPDVLSRTRAIAGARGLKWIELPPLPDIDTAEDLAAVPPLLSVVVPALNESSHLARLLPDLVAAAAGLLPRCRVWVCDGGSTDDSVAVARACGAEVVCTDAGRARQMNAGAAAADGRWLWFLHADCAVPTGSVGALAERLERHPRHTWGYFGARLDAPGWRYRMNERLIHLRSRWLGLPFGDQGLFVRRSCFEHIGGYPAVPILEDLMLARALGRSDRPLRMADRLGIDTRRWRAGGFWHTTARNWRLQFDHLILGRDCSGLAAKYNTGYVPTPTERTVS